MSIQLQIIELAAESGWKNRVLLLSNPEIWRKLFPGFLEQLRSFIRQQDSPSALHGRLTWYLHTCKMVPPVPGTTCKYDNIWGPRMEPHVSLFVRDSLFPTAQNWLPCHKGPVQGLTKWCLPFPSHKSCALPTWKRGYAANTPTLHVGLCPSKHFFLAEFLSALFKSYYILGFCNLPLYFVFYHKHLSHSNSLWKFYFKWRHNIPFQET